MRERALELKDLAGAIRCRSVVAAIQLGKNYESGNHRIASQNLGKFTLETACFPGPGSVLLEDFRGAACCRHLCSEQVLQT
jgi:hypothetical protein